MFKVIKAFLGNRRGSVATVFLLSLPILIGTSGLAIEYGNALVVRTVNQRVADAAAYAGALALNSTGSESVMESAAERIATLNNLGGASVVATKVASPSDSTRQAVQVSIAQPVTLVLTKFFTGKGTQNVSVVATAELISQAANCIVALDGGSTGIEVSGGANIKANNCGVASEAQLKVANCGAYIQTNSATYNTTTSLPSNCGGNFVLRKADGVSQQAAVKRPVTDPYGGTEPVTTATARLSTVSSMSAPSNPTFSFPSGGTTVNFQGGYSQSAINAVNAAAQANGCTAAWTGSNSNWSYQCPSGSNTVMKIGTICGGCTLSLNTNASASTVLTINSSISAASTMTFGYGTINIGGNYTGGYGGTVVLGSALNISGFFNGGSSGTITLADGTYNIGQGIYLTGSSTVTFGKGTFTIGKGNISCSGGFYSICATSSGTTTFGGPSTFILPGGIRTGGGATLNLGSGNGNSYMIGTSSDGYAFRGDGGAKTAMFDATGSGNVYQFGGHVNLTGGGSCLIVGAASQHDIKGNLWGTGAMKLGAGIYTVTGSVNFGGSGGGDSSCGGSTIGIYADQVTFVVGASAGSLATSGVCANQAFCLAAGYGHVTINAPAGGATPGFALIGPQSASNTAGATFTSGASNTVITGVFYNPNGAVNLAGGAGLGSASGCLELYGKSVSVSAGAVLGSSCQSSGGAVTYKVRLVQ